MIFKPQLSDVRTISYYIGMIVLGVGITMAIPIIFGFAVGESYPASDFVISLEITLMLGIALTRLKAAGKTLTYAHSMVVVSLSWLVAMALNAIPLYLSGHYLSYLDACFETMSGLTTTGLTLVQDLDHMSYTHNLWRHLGPFIGGQGITIVALSLLTGGGAGEVKLYAGEGREEKLVPNVIHTSRIIWIISILYLILGTLVLGIICMNIGFKPFGAFFNGVCIFMAGFDTAGFTPSSQGILYYHSLIFEIAVIVIMILGALNFNLHYQLMHGNLRELRKNIETKAFLIAVIVTYCIVMLGLNQMGVYSQALVFFRKGFFQLISGHTTTGYMTIYAKQFINDFGGVAMIGIIIAMALGGCACSTAGGVKMLRVGIIFKSLGQDFKRLLLPDSAVVTQRFHHIRDCFLDDKQARATVIIVISYLAVYILGAIIGVLFGYPLLDSLFESTSAAANVGFSCGITDASMPIALKITYIIQMWAGRLEFMSVFALVGFFVAFLKGKC